MFQSESINIFQHHSTEFDREELEPCAVEVDAIPAEPVGDRAVDNKLGASSVGNEGPGDIGTLEGTGGIDPSEDIEGSEDIGRWDEVDTLEVEPKEEE